jgi:DNA-binding XRE family transcriptional regulator
MVLQSVVPTGMSVSSMVAEVVWLANTDAGCLADDSVPALGCHQHLAEAGRVRLMVVVQGARVVAVGVISGVAVALAFTRTLGSLLFGVKAVDALTFVGMSASMVAIGLLASYVPARRLKLSLAGLVRSVRQRAKLSQRALAERLGSSQSRVAKLEAGDVSVSLDLIVKAAFAAGARKSELAQVISRERRPAVP